MLNTVHKPTGSACPNVRRVSARFRHFALLTKAPQRNRELAASGCCFVYSIRRCSVMISIAARRGTLVLCYQNGNSASSCSFPLDQTHPKELGRNLVGNAGRHLVGKTARQRAKSS